jgi:4,5-DOPA dioxygenase extradiol
MPAASRMPVLFVGHGSPMNAIEVNRWSEGFRSLHGLLPQPRAILAISAHWYIDDLRVTAMEAPRTIHDFGGFPPELYRVHYPAPGDPALAERVCALLGPQAHLDADWGLDHGTWSVLRHVWPQADVPVVQLSIPRQFTAADRLELGAELSVLREEGVLIFGSGNIVHNLHDAFTRMSSGDLSTPEWAARFDAAVAAALEARDHGFLSGALTTPDGRQAHPSPDHYLPLLYTAAAASSADAVRFPITGFDLGSLSMRAVIWEDL